MYIKFKLFANIVDLMEDILILLNHSCLCISEVLPLLAVPSI